MPFKRVHVYYTTIKLLESLDINTSKCPSWLKRERLAPMKADITDILAYIVEGSTEKEKLLPNILAALKILEKHKFRLRAYSDCRYLTTAGYGQISRLLEQTRRELTGWGLSQGMKKTDLPESLDIYDPQDKVEFN